MDLILNLLLPVLAGIFAVSPVIFTITPNHFDKVDFLFCFAILIFVGYCSFFALDQVRVRFYVFFSVGLIFGLLFTIYQKWTKKRIYGHIGMVF